MGRRDNRRSMKMRRRTRQRKLKARLAKKRGVARDKVDGRWRGQARQEESRRGQEVAPVGAGARHGGNHAADAAVPRRQGDGTRTRSSSSGWATSTRCSSRTPCSRRALLDLTLTTRDKGKDDAVPDVRRPAPRGARLPREADRARPQGRDLRAARGSASRAKGIVKREVVRVVTPGVVLDEECSTRARRSYVAAVLRRRARRLRPGVPRRHHRRVPRAPRPRRRSALRRRARRASSPRELVLGRGDDDRRLSDLIAARASRAIAGARTRRRRRRARGATLARVAGRRACDADASAERAPRAVAAAGAVLRYARATQPAGALPVARLVVYRRDDALVLDERRAAHLELTESLLGRRTSRARCSTSSTRPRTAPGGRLLRRWLLYPLSTSRASAAATTRSSAWSSAHARARRGSPACSRRRRSRAPGRRAPRSASRRRATSAALPRR